MVMKKFVLISLSSLLLFSSCSSYTTTGAAMGGMVGSAIGGLAGGHRGSDIGTLVGVVTGAAMGAAAEEHDRAEYYRSRAYDDMYYTRGAEHRVRKAEERAARAEERARRAERRALEAERKNQRSSFRLERSKDPGTVYFSIPSDGSKYSKDSLYDDRIEMK